MHRLKLATFSVTIVALTLTLGAQPIPRTQRTQQAIISEIIARHLELGRLIQLDTPRHNEAIRRAQAGQILCEWAIILEYDLDFQFQTEQVCAALREQWPWLLEDCPPCRN